MTRTAPAPTNEQLIRRYRRGDAAALDALLAKNRGMCFKLAAKYAAAEDLDDAVQEAHLCLIDCANGFKAKYKILFVTYAWTSISRRLQAWSRKQDLIRLPECALARGEERRHVSYEDRDKLADCTPGREATPLELAAECELRCRSYRQMRILLSKLDRRERKILFARARGETLESLGERLGVNKERIRQLQTAALETIGAVGKAI